MAGKISSPHLVRGSVNKSENQTSDRDKSLLRRDSSRESESTSESSDEDEDNTNKSGFMIGKSVLHEGQSHVVFNQPTPELIEHKISNSAVQRRFNASARKKDVVDER